MKNIGLVGFGFIGKTHFHAYQKIENARVTAICTKNPRNTPLSNYEGIYVTDYDDLLNNKEIDLIDICLPTYLHEEYIIRAANAGKSIICEKPLTLSLKSANRILEAVQKNDVELFVAHVLRFWPEYKVIKTYCESGKLKDIELITAKRLGQSPKWSSWFQYPEKSGGALYDLLLHDVDFLFFLLGEVESVYAVGIKNKYGAWDHVMSILSFKNNTRAYVEASQRMPEGFPFTMSLRAQTTDNLLDFQIIAGENIENRNTHSSKFIYYSKEIKKHIKVEQEDPFQNELSYFVDCIENNQVNQLIPLEDVLYSLKLLKAIETSLETGQEIRMN
ncbi:Gfo/Idh/MocA family protein [Bacillus massilinigeriensis]|uniref:Gfo/Idh/MocA family protein n=1 Tax=Bacillus massilionigeriensis TaxID=1805475 RepID=UPI000A767A79|nr:Gfo/Idh/MocA family oxidoreductase [Bacillus massilionigeriensis]